MLSSQSPPPMPTNTPPPSTPPLGQNTMSQEMPPIRPYVPGVVSFELVSISAHAPGNISGERHTNSPQRARLVNVRA